MIRVLITNLQNIVRELKTNKSANLSEWRQRGEKVIFMAALILLPVSLLFSLPTYLTENRYGLIAFDLAIIIILFIRLLYARGTYRFWMTTWLILIYVMMVTFFITLGPYYARPAWLIFSSVVAALFFGTLAGIGAVFINMIILFSLYYLLGPGNTAWTSVYADPFSKYLMFVVNTTAAALLPTLMAAFMLNRLDQTHNVQQQIMQDLQGKIENLKLAEEELRESEERLRAIFQANPDPVVVYDANGYPLYLNPAFTMVFGWDLNEVQGKRIPFVPKDQEKISTDKIKEIYKSGNNVQFETKRLSKQGRTIDILLSAAIMKDIQGINNGLVVNLKDITEQKNIEIQLRQSQKTEAIGTLAGGIAHDFNNILSGILGYAQLTEMDSDDAGKVRKNIKQVVKATQRASDLVQQILTFSRQAEHTTQPLKLFLIVKEAIKFLRSSIPTTIEIQDKISSKATVLADPTQAHQVIMNLCTNAYHAMRDSGGTLSVELDDIEIAQHSHSTTNSHKPGNYIKLEVRDTGPGMDKETLERIFDPYFTTKQLEKGTGLGLAVVDGIIKKHNGFIRTYSEVGQGSTFQIFWPVIEKDDSSGILKKTKTDLPRGTEQIMFVDDETNILATSKIILEKQGYKVTICKDGFAALQTFTKNPNFFDLVITDMAMPHMAGDELSAQILKLRKDIPIILCTGFSETMSEEKATSLGIKGFLLKPIVMNDLTSKVREVLDKK